MLPLEISQLDFVVNNKRLLHNVELKLSDTGVSIIMGHNGAGKSILLRCMHGLLEPDKGTILWAGNKASCLLYTSPSPRDKRQSRMPSSA